MIKEGRRQKNQGNNRGLIVDLGSREEQGEGEVMFREWRVQPV